MKIISLRAENVKRLRAVEITPDGNTVVIAGRNGQGKSSVLDSIWMALAGAAGAKETSRPIRDGEEKASVELDLGDLIVTRRWTAAGTTLEVAARDGAKYGSPQTLLDGLIGRLTFDPLAFAQQDSKGQRAALLEVLDLPFDPDDVDARKKHVYEDRTVVNREVKRIETLVADLPIALGDTPDEEISAAAIAAELQEAQEAQRVRAELAERGSRAAADVERLKADLASAEKLLTDLRAEHEGLPAPADPEPIRARLAAVDETNTAVRAKNERARLEAELVTVREQSKSKTAELELLDKETAEAMSQAKMPLDGLSFDETGVLYQGVPFSQASSAEQLRVSVAIAMALNPKIRVIRITDGSLLDSENLGLIEQMAGEHDFQVWIERVDESGKVGVVIEDGQVKAKAAPKAKAQATA